MGKVLCKILDFNAYCKLMGVNSVKEIVELDYRRAMALIKKGIIELGELEREMQGTKEEVLTICKTPEMLKFLQQPNLLDLLVERVQENAVGEKPVIETIIIISTLSKVRNKSATSANLCLNSESGAGKDYILSATLKLIPDKYLFVRRRVSPKALDYALAANQGRDWNFFIVYLEDVSNAVLNSETVKTLMSADSTKENIVSIIHEGTIKNLRLKGKPTFFMTSAKAQGSDEIMRRLPFCRLDESPEQTFQINLKQARDAIRGKIKETTEASESFYEGLEPVNVIVPFAEELAHKLAEHWIKRSKRYQVIQRSLFPRFLDYVKASACLHQHQREKNHDGFVIAAAPEDYNNARTALLQTTSNSLMLPLSHEENELLKVLMTNFSVGGTTKEIAIKFSLWSERWLGATLDKLTQRGFIEKSKTYTEGSDKAAALYTPIPDILNFSMPEWNELQNTSIASNASNASIASIASNAFVKQGKEKKEMKELKELKPTYGKKNVSDCYLTKEEPSDSVPLPADWRPPESPLPWLQEKKEKIPPENDKGVLSDA